MQPLIARKDRTATRRDPAPSRWGYRYQRMMLTPVFRFWIRFGVPVLLIAIIAGVWSSHEANRKWLSESYAAIVHSVQNRPEFMVAAMGTEGADPDLSDQIRAVLPVNFPISSFDLDLDAMRQTVEAVSAVERAVLRVKAGGILEVAVTPRTPVAIWRSDDGLKLIDANGAFVGPLETRAARLDLPLIAGDGAKESIAEALALYAVAGPIASRVRGVVRMGERRWDVVLDRDQRILLPEEGAVQAFQRVIVMAQSQGLLERDVAAVDVRNEARATVRLNENAVETMRQINASIAGTGK